MTATLREPEVKAPDAVTTAPRLSKRRHPALDGLRGLAILGTVIVHYEIRTWPYRTGILSPAWIIIQHGWLGVETFFVISGFLITGILYDAKSHPHYWRNYYARRMLRIFPLYLLTLATIFFILPTLGGDAIGASAIAPSTQAWFWTFTQNALIAVRGFGASPVYASHLWTLAIEEQFYCVWPLVIFLCARRRLLWFSLIASFVSLGLRIAAFALSGNSQYALMLTPMRLDGLALGAFAALLIRGPGGANAYRTAARRLLVGLLVAVAALEIVHGRNNPEDAVVGTVGLWGWSAVLACSVMLLVTSPPTRLAVRLLAWRPLQMAGTLCFGIYAWHYILLIALNHRGFTTAALEAHFGSTWRAHAVYLLVNSAGTFVLAFLSWHLYEKQFLKLKRLFPYANDAGASRASKTHYQPAVAGAVSAA